MRLLTDGGPQPRAVLLVGEGLLGSAIRGALRRRRRWDEQALPLAWDDPRGLDEGVAQGAAALRAVPLGARIDVVWAAGRAGFGVDEDGAAVERETFARALAPLLSAVAARPPGSITFHLLSSAGGLFEGQAVRAPDTTPAPLRAYGRLKAWQEEHLLAVASAHRLRVHRPSSVYGPLRPGQRRGLISVLVDNALKHRVTQIFGDLHTLRDYVHAADVGDFVARTVFDDDPAPVARYVLATARPSSIHTIRHTVERALQRRVYVTLRPEATASRPITFSPACLPRRGWQPRTLAVGVGELIRDARGRSETELAMRAAR